MILILQSTFGQLTVWLAPVCSTWVSISVGSSKRSILCPAGDESTLQNRKANKSAARTLGGIAGERIGKDRSVTMFFLGEPSMTL